METTTLTSVLFPNHTASLLPNSDYTMDGSDADVNGTSVQPILTPGVLAVTTIAYGIIFFFGVTGNALVAIVIWQNADMRSSTNYFLVNLSIADLMVILVCLPPSMLELYIPDWILGKFMCYLVTILDSAAAHASILTLLAIAVERYYVICMPFKANYTCTSKRTLIICCLVWLIAFISSVPLALIVYYSNTEAGCICSSFANTTLKEAYVGGIAVGFFLLPCAFMAIIYCVISNTLRKHDNYMAAIRNKESLAPASETPACREGRLVELASMPRKNSGDYLVENNYVPLTNHVTSNSTNEDHEPTVAFIENEASHEAAMRPSPHQSSSNSTCQNIANAATRQAHRRVVLMLASVVAVFFLCWFPMRTVILWQIFAPKESIRSWLTANMHTFQVMIAIFRILVYINSAINPILYNLISSKFRVAFRAVIRCENARKSRSKRSISTRSFTSTSSLRIHSRTTDYHG